MPPEVPTIDVDEARRRLDAGAVLLDVREPDEWEAGRVDGAVLISLRDLPTRHAELPAGRGVIAYCESGGRSARATAALIAWGHDAVNLEGGVQAWSAAGHPLVPGAA